jgi:hypothetical protein
MPQTIQIEAKVTVSNDDVPFSPTITRSFGKRALVNMDVPEAAHELREMMENLQIPSGRADFLRALFESWGQSMTRVMLRWLAEVHEGGGLPGFGDLGEFEEDEQVADWEA